MINNYENITICSRLYKVAMRTCSQSQGVKVITRVGGVKVNDRLGQDVDSDAVKVQHGFLIL